MSTLHIGIIDHPKVLRSSLLLPLANETLGKSLSETWKNMMQRKETNGEIMVNWSL